MVPDSPLVSICLPTLNARSFLAARVESILGQTQTDWELIICDSFSDDGTWEYLQQFWDDPRVRLYQVPKEGLYAGWNECLRRCRGEYVYVATADDTCKPELLEKMVGALERVTTEHTEGTERERPVDIAVCDFEFIDEGGAVISPPRGTARSFYGEWIERPHVRSGLLEYLVHSWIDISWITMTAVLFRRSLLEKTGLFPADVGMYGDLVWAQRTALRSDTVFIPEKLATWRVHSDQSSNRFPLRDHQRLQQVGAKELVRDESLIPHQWRSDPLWREKLLWGIRKRYFSSFGLDRKTIRRSPRQFLLGAFRAGLYAPCYLCSRLSTGFPWNAPELMDGEDYLHERIQEWQIPWPPVAVNSEVEARV